MSWLGASQTKRQKCPKCPKDTPKMAVASMISAAFWHKRRVAF